MTDKLNQYLKKKLDTIASDNLLSFIISLLLHIVVFIIFFNKIHFKSDDIVSSENFITFEVMPVADVTNLKNSQKNENKVDIDGAKRSGSASVQKQELDKLDHEKEKKPVDSMKLEEPSKSEEKAVSEKEEKKDALKQDSKKVDVTIPDKTKVDKKEEKVTESKKDIKKDGVKDKKKVEDKKKDVVNKKQDKKEDKKYDQIDLESLLKNLEDPSNGKNEKSDQDAKKKSSDNDLDIFTNSDSANDELSITHDDMIKSQIEKYWIVPQGSIRQDDIFIKLKISIMKNGVVNEIKILKNSCRSQNNMICRAMEDSVIRAVQQASPFESLMPEDYDSWKTVILTFRPQDAFR